MKTVYSMIAVGAMLTAFSAAAAGSSQDRIPELQREAPMDETLTGCVTRGTAAGAYVLTNSAKDGNDRRTTATERFERTSVALSGSNIDVDKHVGHRVSVTGRYAPAALVAPTSGIDTSGIGARTSAAESVAQADKRAMRTFRVTSLAMVSDSCSQPAD